MTAAELRALITEWQDTARRDLGAMSDAIEQLTGVDVRADFGDNPHPIPVCPACGWESAREDQSDFHVIGPDPGPARIEFGCGHRWDIVDIPAAAD